MDFADSADEAAFRLRLREWLRDNNPGLPASSTSDEYWAGQAAVASVALRRRLLRPVVAYGDRRPGAAERLRRDPRRRARRRRRAAPAEPRLPRAGDPRARQRRHPPAVPARASSTAANAGARGSASPTPARTSRRCGPAPCATATSTSSPGTRCGPATPTSPTGAWCWPAPTPTWRSTRASPRSPIPMDQPGIEQRPLQMINGITREFGEVLFDGARVPAADMIGEPGEGWRLAMTVVSHEREPGELGYVVALPQARQQLAGEVHGRPRPLRRRAAAATRWAIVETEMLRAARSPPAVRPARRHHPRPEGRSTSC